MLPDEAVAILRATHDRKGAPDMRTLADYLARPGYPRPGYPRPAEPKPAKPRRPKRVKARPVKRAR